MRKWFVMEPTAEGAFPDVYAIELNEEHELIMSLENRALAEQIVREHNEAISKAVVIRA